MGERKGVLVSHLCTRFFAEGPFVIVDDISGFGELDCGYTSGFVIFVCCCMASIDLEIGFDKNSIFLFNTIIGYW